MAENPLMGLLNSDVLRGVAGAAAFGVNPLYGLLAAPMLRNQRESRSLEMDARRAELREMNRRRQSVDELQGLLAARGTPPERANADVPRIQTPAGQRQALGLLVDISSNVASQGLLTMLQPQQGQRPTSFMQNAEAAGVLPGTPEFAQAWMKTLGVDNATEETLQRVNLAVAEFQLDQARQKRDREERTIEQERLGRRQAIRRTFGTVESLIGLNRKLDGTSLAPGIPAPDFRRDTVAAFSAALQTAGIDQTERQQLISDFDSFRKGTNELVIQTIDRFGANLTNDKLQVLEDASVSASITPQAAAGIFAEVLEINLDQAAIEGVRVENTEKWRRLIAEQRAFARGEKFGSDEDADRRQRFDSRRSARPSSDLTADDLRGLADDELMRMLDR